jgi:DNA polymerase-3 subunit epsilon
MTTIAVIDFETTGMSPETGGRATEIGVVVLRDSEVVDRYQSLMNAGVWVPPFIEALTGISNEMVRTAPPAARVMAQAADFVGDLPLVAHNAAFDRRFWDAELGRLGRSRRQAFACTLLLSRRIHPEAPSHRLASLVEFHGLPVAGRHHRALADAEMAASLLRHQCETLGRRFGLARVTHRLLCEIQSVPRKRIEGCIALHAATGSRPAAPEGERAGGLPA